MARLNTTTKRLVRLMKRPESLLAASVFGLACAVGTLVAVSMASCQSGLDLGSIGGESQSTQPPRRPAIKKDAQSGKPADPPPGAPITRDVPRTVGEPDLRVRILTAVDTVRVQAPGGVRIAMGDPRGLTSEPLPGLSGTANGWSAAEVVVQPVTVSLRAGVWTLSTVAGNRPSFSPALSTSSGGAALLIAPAVEGQILSVNGGSFPGVLRLSGRSDVRPATFDVIEFVGLEDYLPGVVAKEMLAGWPAEAYRAQAVAARTYAMHERERSIAAGQSFDLESSDKDQVYSGTTSNRAALQAVQATRGQALFDGDKVLRTYFSSTCGGRTAAAKDTWPTGRGFEYNLAAPIQAFTRPHACEKSPLYRWTVSRTRKELAARLRTFGEKNGLMVRQLKDLKAIEPMSLNADGRASRFKIVQGDGKWFQLSGEELRLACNTSVAGPGAIPVPGGAPATDALPAPSPSASPAEFPDITRGTRVNSSDLDVKLVGDKFVITGRGFGHGVGLCQYCANGFAQRGEDYRMMLTRFYPGASLKQAY